MTSVVLDFETASACDLKKCGAWVYAEHPTTEILCLGYSAGNSQPTVREREHMRWLGNSTPAAFAGQLEALANDPTVLFIAHNTGFEKAIWRRIMVPLLGWPDIPNNRWHDSMAVCAMKALPLRLEKAAAVLRLHSQKDLVGSRLTISLSKTNRAGASTITPENLRRVYDYNVSDVLAEVELSKRVGGFQPGEADVWRLDQRINERGVRVDLEYVAACQRIVDEASVPLANEFLGITGVRAGQRDKLLAWVQERGVVLLDLRKETLVKLLGAPDIENESDVGEESESDGTAEGSEDDSEEHDTTPIELPTDVRRALEIRQVLGSASIKKLRAIERTACADGRIRGALQYHAAGPGRWGGRLLQPQNFPRPSLKWENADGVDCDSLVAALMTGDHQYVQSLFGPPIEAVISGLRHSIIADPGRQLCVGDFATIEARIVLALAGQHDKVKLLADGKDIYVAMATEIYKRPIDKKKDPEERQTGKGAVLGLGFQMGWRKARERFAAKFAPDFAKEIVRVYREDFAPEVPKLWAGLEEAAITAVWEKRPCESYGVLFRHEDLWLTARLPSGRKLYYFNPQPIRKAMPWDETDIRRAWTCQAQKGGRWITRDMYGGLLTENVVQALARDLMVAAMFKCETNNLPAVLTVHDEIVAEPLTGHADPVLLHQLMSDTPAWAKALGIPIATECWTGGRYRK